MAKTETTPAKKSKALADAAFQPFSQECYPPDHALVLVRVKRSAIAYSHNNYVSDFMVPRLDLAICTLVYSADGFGNKHPQHFISIVLHTDCGNSPDKVPVGPQAQSRIALEHVAEWMLLDVPKPKF